MKDNEGSVFVLGGGRIGLTAVRDLVASNFPNRIVVGDIDTSKAANLAKELGSGRLDVAKVDLTNHADLVAAIKHSAVLVNAAWYEYNVEVMNAAIEAGVNYLDMGGLFHVTRKQLEMNEKATRAGVTAVLGAGESPGITNVLCAMSSQELDSVEDIRIRVGGREKTASEPGKLVFPFAIPTVFDEYSKAPVMFMNGRFQEVEPLSGEEETSFPDPVGKQTCHYSIHSEIATLPLNIRGVRNVDFKLGISENIYRAIKPLLDAGMASTDPIEIRGGRVSPREFAISLLTSRTSDADPARYVALRTEVTGTRKGKKLRLICELIGEPSDRMRVKNATALLTGIGASVTAQLIMNGKIRDAGVLAPETCIPASELTSELSKRGIMVHQRELPL